MITDITSGKNNYCIELNINTAIYSYEIKLNGRTIKKIFPSGTIRKQVQDEAEKILKEKK